MEAVKLLVILCFIVGCFGCEQNNTSIYGGWRQLEKSEQGFTGAIPKNSETIRIYTISVSDSEYCIMSAYSGEYHLLMSDCQISEDKINIVKVGNLSYQISGNKITFVHPNKKKMVYSKIIDQEKK